MNMKNINQYLAQKDQLKKKHKGMNQAIVWFKQSLTLLVWSGENEVLTA